MPEGQEGGQPQQAERQLPKVEQRGEGIFLGKTPLYNPEVNGPRDPFLEAVAPELVEGANRFAQEHPDQAGFPRDSFRRIGLNPDLINLKVNKFPTPEELMESKRG